MADVTGTLHHPFEGKTYALCLTMRGIAKLQGIHGNDLGGILTGANAVPSFAVLLDIVAEGLRRGGDLADQDADDLADKMLTADKNLAERVLKLAFPETAAGKGEAAGGATT